MQPEVILTVRDEQGRVRQVDLSGLRLTIGRSPDNDLCIEDRGLSRRHALIETFDGLTQISDCGSQNGTLVNGVQVRGSSPLKDGDVISIGNACDIEVRIINRTRPGAAPIAKSARAAQEKHAGPPLDETASARPWATTPVIAVAAMVAVLLVAVPVLVLLKGEKRARPRNSSEDFLELANQSRPADSNGRIETSGDAPGRISSSPASGSEPISPEQLERAAAQVMSRISKDDRPYIFPSNSTDALARMRKKIEEYRSSPSLAGVLNSLSQRAPEIAMRARREGIEPDLVFYTALAETDGGRRGADAAATAREIMPELLSLKAMFGTEMADKSLILVAAYRMGGGTRKSHPLLATMRRLVNNPLTDRNVWYLHEHGGLDAEVYNFVLSFIALGVIAQNPRQYGIAATPLAS